MVPAPKPLIVLSPDTGPVFRGRVARYAAVYRAGSPTEPRPSRAHPAPQE
jgi:hypothetical protein